MVQDTSREEDSLGRSPLDEDDQELHKDIHKMEAGRDIHTAGGCTDMLHMDAD